MEKIVKFPEFDNLDGGWHFERPHVERLIFRNLKIANVEVMGGPFIRFFKLLVTIFF